MQSHTCHYQFNSFQAIKKCPKYLFCLPKLITYSLQLQNSLSSEHCCNYSTIFCTWWVENPSRLDWRKCTSPLSLPTLLFLSVCHWNNSPFLLNESISVSWFMCIFCHWVAGVIKLPRLAVCGGQIAGMCTLLGQKMTIQQFYRWAKKKGKKA